MFDRAHIIVVMARRRNITPRFDIEDEILAAPIASISDIATKLKSAKILRRALK